ncbi:hypothetical protein [Microbacterium sp. UBA837]|uniref:hypothetical protein n=1 Tax=unclassified Microbacterium TaxID=2609290 RepID=UPI0025E88229|nr:hypothetical protein [Microbacterium sp. UBA837]
MPSTTPSPATGNRLRGYFLPVGLHARIKAAWWGTRDTADAAPTLASLVAQLLVAGAGRLEDRYNDGEPFPAAPEGARGRALGDGEQRNHSYFLPDAVHARAKAAWWATRDRDAGYPSMSSMVAALLTEEATRLEEKYNAGAPFPEAPIGARGVDPEAARRQAEMMASLWAERSHAARND